MFVSPGNSNAASIVASMPPPMIPDENGTGGMPRAESTCVDAVWIPSSCTSQQALDVFEQFPDLVCLPVVELANDQPLGLINRNIFMSSLAKPFYKEIYLGKTCLVFMDKDALVVDAAVPLKDLSILIAEAGEKVVSDGFIITAGGRFRGMGFTRDLLSRMAAMHEANAQQLAHHRDNLESVVQERTAELARARDAAEEAVRVKTAFLANMSHEIRTPMNAIIGFANLMTKDDLTPKQADRLGKIGNAARHLLAIINDILDLSKIGAGRMELECLPVDVGAVVANVVSMLADSAAGKGLTLDSEVAVARRRYLGDATRLTQSLLNFAGNAVKFTERGYVHISCRMIETSSDGTLLRFEVRDTGIGIPSDVLPSLFHPFQQGDGSMTRRFGGTGLGLSITRHLANLMGGDAGADSMPGLGSVFWFTARLQPAPEVASGTAENQEASGAWCVADDPAAALQACAGRRVLLVEDEPINREIVLEYLTDAGLLVDSAADGAQAVALVRKQSYSLILMDMQMPVMDGLAATAAIRKLPFGADVPVIALTANAFASDRELCLAAGMNDFIAKPFEPEALYVILARLLLGARISRPAPSAGEQIAGRM